MAYFVYKDFQNMWHWYLCADNNRKIAICGEAYKTKQECLAAIQLVKSADKAPVYNVPVNEHA